MGVGGLAVPGGVAIVARGRVAVAVRAPSGGLEVRVLAGPAVPAWALRVPVVRGVAAVAASVAAALRAVRSACDGHVRSGDLVVAGPVALAWALALLVGLPLLVSSAAGLPWLDGPARAACVVLWLLVLRTHPAGRDLYAYHAAEHRVVNAFEALGRVPSPEEAALHSDRHPRCGFGLLVAAVLLAAAVMPATPPAFRPLVLPLLAGLGWELLAVPGVRRLALAAQALVLAPCGPEHLEVACAALEEALR